MAKQHPLSRSELSKLKPGEKRHHGGVIYTRLADGDGRWSINVKVGDRRHHKVVGTDKEGYTLTQAQELIFKLKAEKRAATHSIKSRRRDAPRSVNDAIELYLNYLEQHAGRDLKSKRQRLRDHVGRVLGAKGVERLSADDWAKYIVQRRREGGADATINRERSALKHLLNTLTRLGEIAAAPLQLERLREQPNRLRYLSKEEVKRLILAARNDPSPHAELFVMIAVLTGMRQAPILKLAVRDIDVDGLCIYIGKDKAGARYQPMPPSLAAFLHPKIAGLPPEQYLFASPKSSTGRRHQINQIFNRCVERAGLVGRVTPHTLRHTMATHAAQAGHDTATIQMMGGWKSAVMVERYRHGRSMKDAMAVYEKHLGVVGGITHELHTNDETPSESLVGR